MTPHLPRTWPPIIDAAREPRSMLWRDRIFTAAMWLLLAFLCRHTLSAIWIALAGLFDHGHLRLTGWSERWMRLRPYLQLVALLAGWELFWVIATLWRRLRALRRPQPALLTLTEEADRSHRTPEEIAQWRQLRVCVVHLDPAGHPTVAPRTGP
jgi:poly-beta-1,6-N-acetyl-D-glucosamine biosynthesis protein PgaD